MRYVIVIERAGDGCSAHVPDLPGCVATGRTLEEVRQGIADALVTHCAGLRADGEVLPPPMMSADERHISIGLPPADPFVTFTEWAGEADEVAYADL